MRILDGVHVIWLNVRVWTREMLEVNAELYAAAQRWPNLEIVDWNTIASQPGMTWSDGVHLTPRGAAAMSALLRDHLEAWYLSVIRPPVRDVLVAPDGRGGYVLDGWGGLRAFG